jgi:hypothetical protein
MNNWNAARAAFTCIWISLRVIHPPEFAKMEGLSKQDKRKKELLIQVEWKGFGSQPDDSKIAESSNREFWLTELMASMARRQARRHKKQKDLL